MPPAARYRPFSVARRDNGNQSVNALIAPISPADTPRPISARPIESMVKSRANAKISAPAAATQSSAATTRRGP